MKEKNGTSAKTQSKSSPIKHLAPKLSRSKLINNENETVWEIKGQFCQPVTSPYGAGRKKAVKFF